MHNDSDDKTLGPRTKNLLSALGVTDDEIEQIQRGELDWSLFELVEGTNDIVLEHPDYGTRFVCRLPTARAEELLDAHELERRTADQAMVTFPAPEFGDWAGVRRTTDWVRLANSFREATRCLGANVGRDAAPFLFLCRHTLELQLKAVIALSSTLENTSLNHDLSGLWEKAKQAMTVKGESPVSADSRKVMEQRVAKVGQVVEDFHTADPDSYGFRYPTKKDKCQTVVVQKPAVRAFRRSEMLSRLEEAFDTLDQFIVFQRFANALGSGR